MCRLYGLQATHPTKPACELLDAQNAMIQQSRKDSRGLSNPHGWGMGQVVDGTTSCFRQVKPASESPDYREQALQMEGTTVLAHSRRATVGQPDHANTHPLRHRSALLIHNGHVPAFEDVRSLLLDRLDEDRHQIIQGDTDSEHVLALLLQLNDEAPKAPLYEVTQNAVQLLQTWVEEVDPEATTAPTNASNDQLDHDELIKILGLNLLWTDGKTLGGARLNRTLWALQRDEVHTCSVCGKQHAHPADEDDYRATVLASERITNENWVEVPNGSVFHVDTGGALHFELLDGI